MVYLDHFVRTNRKKLIRGEARELMIDTVMDALKDWRLSEFEHEAATRTAIRLHFIERFQSWDVADTEAGALISTAFDRMGVKRPSWAQGQWEYTAPSDRCRGCGGELDEADRADNLRFCSSECARGYYERQNRRSYDFDKQLWSQVRYQIKKSHVTPRPCKRCSRPFRNVDPTALFCSKDCYEADRALEARNCIRCNEVFCPSSREAKYCCMECAQKDLARLRRERNTDKACECCGRIFRPTKADTRYCSRPCIRRAQYLRTKVKRLPILTADIFDSWFQRAA